MELTRKESSVIQRLRRRRIATMKTLCEELVVSRMTVVRGLNRYGYYSSVNLNASYYTLHDTPRFNELGLWTYRDICFSKHGSLGNTLVALAENAPGGLTVLELEQLVKTKVGNLLSRLCRQNELSRFFAGRHAVYLAVDDKIRQRQQQQRERARQESQARLSSSDTAWGTFPSGCDVVTVLEVLMQIIKTPKADAAELARALRARGVKITAVQVQRVLKFYAIQKKTEDWPSRTWRCD